jgi:hypothetical protein
MSFPGTYNISYYKGDTLEFAIFPKDSSGEAFDLEEFFGPGSPAFTIAERRGIDNLDDQIKCFASISDDFSYILCVIRPEDGERLVPGQQYVYDIEISKPSNPYNIVYTLLTGTVTVTDQVTTPLEEDES